MYFTDVIVDPKNYEKPFIDFPRSSYGPVNNKIFL